MNTAALFNETVELLAAALGDPTCSPERLDYLREEAARLRRSLRRLWELRRGPARGEGTPHKAPRIRRGLVDDTKGDVSRQGISQRGMSFYGDTASPHYAQARRDQRRRRDAAD